MPNNVDHCCQACSEWPRCQPEAATAIIAQPLASNAVSMLQIAEQATSSRQRFTADADSAAAKANPNRRGKWWIPAILLAQIAFKVGSLLPEPHEGYTLRKAWTSILGGRTRVPLNHLSLQAKWQHDKVTDNHTVTSCASQVFVLDRLIEDDGIRGDEYGDFDKEVVSEERARLKRTKVARPRLSFCSCAHTCPSQTLRCCICFAVNMLYCLVPQPCAKRLSSFALLAHLWCHDSLQL